MALWTLCVGAKSPSSIKPAEGLRLRNVALAEKLNDSLGITVVFACIEGPGVDSLPQRFAIATLTAGTREQASIDLVFPGGCTIKFEVTGPNNVSLSGDFISGYCRSSLSPPPLPDSPRGLSATLSEIPDGMSHNPWATDGFSVQGKRPPLERRDTVDIEPSIPASRADMSFTSSSSASFSSVASTANAASPPPAVSSVDVRFGLQTAEIACLGDRVTFRYTLSNKTRCLIDATENPSTAILGSPSIYPGQLSLSLNRACSHDHGCAKVIPKAS
ncbi:hypothetical protein ONZ45_g16162 [Pleurotus djamor]|nr:hypothetical protein ONZ45_g16162 [Pleurotus djamor]